MLLIPEAHEAQLQKLQTMTLLLTERRCSCGKLLFRGLIFEGVIEIKCRSCKSVNYYKFDDPVEGYSSFTLSADSNHRIIGFSYLAPDLLGYTKETLLSLSLRDIFPFVDNLQVFASREWHVEYDCVIDSSLSIRKSMCKCTHNPDSGRCIFLVYIRQDVVASARI